MRMRLFLFILSAVMLVGAAAAPKIIAFVAPRSDYIRVSARGYAKSTVCSGIVEQPDQRQVFLSAPVIAEQVLVSPGDKVSEGETLAVVNTELTKSVLSHSISVDTDAQEEWDMDLNTADPEAIRQAAALYGISPDALLPAFKQHKSIKDVEDTSETIVIPDSVLAPMTGVITRVDMQSGVLTQTSSPVFTIANDAKFIVTAQVGENQIASVQVGDPVIVTVGAVDNNGYQGVVTALAPVAERAAAGQQATVGVSIEILNPDAHLKSNYSAVVEIISQESRRLLTLPYEAVRQDNKNVEYIWIYENGRAVKQPVITGEEMADCVEILSGADENDVILLSPSLRESGPVWLGKETLS